MTTNSPTIEHRLDQLLRNLAAQSRLYAEARTALRAGTGDRSYTALWRKETKITQQRIKDLFNEV